MRIAYIVSQFPSLTETFIAREIQQIARLDHEVTICVLRFQAAKGTQGLFVPEARFLRVCPDAVMLFTSHLWALSTCSARYFSTFLEAMITMLRKPPRALHVLYVWLSAIWLAYRLRTEQIEYIHSHFLHNEAISAMWLAKILEIPYGITSHVASIRHDRRLIQKVANTADVLIGDTEQTLTVYYDLTKRPAVLVRNGVDLQQLQVIERVSIKEDCEPLILAIGTFSHAKGFHVLIQACALLRKRTKHFRCRIIGDGVERQNLKRLIQENSLTGIVDLPGVLAFDALREQYHQATVLVMPSIPSHVGSDGLPTVLIEAMAQGIPVIGTRHAGLPDLIRHQQTGLLAEPDDAQMLADYIYIFLNDLKLRTRMASNGRHLVEQEFNLRSNSIRLADLMIQAVCNHDDVHQ
jgi:glycosyltransferase involved in cell wall biosynthesis